MWGPSSDLKQINSVILKVLDGAWSCRRYGFLPRNLWFPAAMEPPPIMMSNSSMQDRKLLRWNLSWIRVRARTSMIQQGTSCTIAALPATPAPRQQHRDCASTSQRPKLAPAPAPAPAPAAPAPACHNQQPHHRQPPRLTVKGSAV